MGAWFVMNMLGFYPVSPASGAYTIGSPMFASATLQTGAGTALKIVAKNQSPTNVYVQSLTWNGCARTHTHTHTHTHRLHACLSIGIPTCACSVPLLILRTVTGGVWGTLRAEACCCCRRCRAPFTGTEIKYSDMMAGGTLEFTMGSKPAYLMAEPEL